MPGLHDSQPYVCGWIGKKLCLDTTSTTPQEDGPVFENSGKFASSMVVDHYRFEFLFLLKQ
jgi:hypothetical protein